ncbi:iron ABC transporter permease [Siminovitchia sp. FSL H7-0308]|uniref:FecCD family ABC transporter permease n=1 Tax=Siminovitchia sp. FSL H7-0308 TaxID=2921432 RepID=UPI0030EF2414
MNRQYFSFIGVSTLLLVAIYISINTGSIKVSPLELFTGLILGAEGDIEVIKDLRLPRIIISLFAGAALSVSGVLFQAVMRNPLADPSIIGVTSGAGFMSILLVTIFPTLFFYMPLFAFLGGALAFLLVYMFSWKTGLDPLRMILVGVAINAVFSGLSQSFNYRGSYAVTSVSQATTSTLEMKKWSDVEVMVTYGSVGLIIAMFLFAFCNYLAMEDKTAKSLGVRVNQARFIISAVAVLLASVATAIAGMIAFIGLIVPHIGRILVGTDHKKLIPFAALAGAFLMLAADTLGRTMIAPNEIPASILMAVIGGPFLIILIRKSGQLYGN